MLQGGKSLENPKKGSDPFSRNSAFIHLLVLAISWFAPVAYAAQVCTVATNTTSIPAPITANQLIYSPAYNRLVVRNSAAIASIDLGTGQSTTHSSNMTFVDMAMSPSERYVFGADYGGENYGDGPPVNPNYVHRLDVSSNTWESKTAYVAGGIQAVSDDQFILKSRDQWITFTNNSWSTGSAVVPLNTPTGGWGPGYYALVYYGDFRYDVNSGRLLHGNSGSSSQEIQAFKIVSNEFVRQDGSGIYGSAQGYGYTVALATDGSAFYYGRLQVNALNVTQNQRVFPEQIFAASANIAFGNGKYFDAHTGDLMGTLGFDATVYALNPIGDGFWAYDSSQNMLRHFTISSTTCPTPPAPIGVGATVSPDTADIIMNWIGFSGSTGYNIYMANQSGVTKTNYASLPGGHLHANVTSPYIHVNAAPGVYYIVVTAFNESGESVESAEVSVWVPDTQAPAVPTGFTAATVSSSRIDLSWNASTDNVGVYYYRIHRGGSHLANVYAPSLSFSDTGLPAATVYTYVVAACDVSSNCSENSAPASATTADMPGLLVFAAQNDVPLNTVITSNQITVTGISVPTAIGITGGEYSIGGGPYTNLTGTVVNGQAVSVRLVSSSNYSTTTSATLTIGSVSGTFSVTTTYDPASLVAAGYAPFPVGATWSYLYDGTPYTTTVYPPRDGGGGRQYMVTIDSDQTDNYYYNDSEGFLQLGSSRPMVGDEPSLSISFIPPMKVLDARFLLGQTFTTSGSLFVYSFTLGDYYYAPYTATSRPAALETVTVPAGTFRALRIDQNISFYDPLNLVVVGSEWRVDGLGLVKSVFTTSDGTTSETSTQVLTASSLLDAAPTPFSFAALTNVALGAQVTSNSITVQGINAGVGISITGGEYNIDGGAFTSAPGTVFNGQSIVVRQTASGNYGATTSATLTIGSVSAVFSVTTLGLHPLTVQTSGSGTVTSDPVGINCGVACSASYLQGTSVTLTAVPGAGTPVFAGWSGGGCSGTGACTVPMNGPTTVTATFVADTQAPSAPGSLAATAVSASQINLAWNSASDNVGVTAYRVFRDGVFRVTVNAPATNFSDTGLSATTGYSYTVAACDAAVNCSAPSGAASATTLAAGQVYFEPKPAPGFNLFGNVLDVTLDVVALFGNQDLGMQVDGVTAYVESVWKWNSVQDRWAFYSPQLSSAGIAAYAAGGGYEVLATIEPGAGYWVKATQPLALPTQSGTGIVWNGFNFAALPSGFNLITDPGGVTPSAFNRQVTEPPPGTGVIPTANFRSLWAWDAAQSKWYFYAPILEASGGLDAVKTYTDTHNLLHFQDYSKTLGVGMGFWVRK